jgi:hypothetical protein
LKRFGTHIVIFASLSLMAGLCGWLYSRQAMFRVEHIEVQVSNEALRKSVEESLVAYSGRSMFALKLSELETQLLRRPEVKSARILRVWPNSLVIEAELKTQAALEFRGQGLWVVDSYGEVIGPLKTARALPLLLGFEEKPDELRSELLHWYLDLRQSDEDEMLGRVDEILFDEGVVLGFGSLGLRVQLGHRNWTQRWARAKAAFVALQKQGRLGLNLDASVEGRVFVYESIELHNSQSGLNLKELVRRTRDARAEVR